MNIEYKIGYIKSCCSLLLEAAEQSSERGSDKLEEARKVRASLLSIDPYSRHSFTRKQETRSDYTVLEAEAKRAFQHSQRLRDMEANCQRLTFRRLEQGNLILSGPPGLPFGWYDSLSERREAIGLPDKEPSAPDHRVSKLGALLTKGGEAARVASWRWRSAIEAREACAKGWYGFFINLTVNRSIYDGRKIMEEGHEWQLFLLKVERKAREALGYKSRPRGGPPQSRFMRYQAHLEHGKTGEHHHMHGIIWLKDVPATWKRDPNIGLPEPIRQECKGLQALWPWGESSPCRYLRCIGDAWTARGFIRPVQDKAGVKTPVPYFPPELVGNYLTKYMLKDVKAWNHRMKASRGYGLLTLRKQLLNLKSRDLEALMSRPETELASSMMEQTSLPSGLLRREARGAWVSKTWASNPTKLRSILWSQPRSSAWSAMCKSVKDGARPWRMDFPHLREWLNGLLSPLVPVGFFETEAALEWAVEAYPAFPPRPPNPLRQEELVR